MLVVALVVIYLGLPTATGLCPPELHGKGQAWNADEKTRLETTISLLKYLVERCGIPRHLPPKDFFSSEKLWKVKLSFQPLQVVNVDEIEQSVTLSSYLILTWTDSSLSWDPKWYQGIEMVAMRLQDTWTPTIIIPKTTQSTGVKLQLPDKVSVRHDGQVRMQVPQFVSTLCKFDMRDFPFDSHRCSIVFLEQEFFLNMTTFEAETSDVKTYFGTNAGWMVNEEGCTPRLANSSQFPTFTYVVCRVMLIRRSAFYVINLIGPMALTSVMTLIVFWIPPEEREKVSFVTSVFMSTSLYLGFILDRLPRSMDSVPYLNLLLIAIVAEVILATVATAFVLQYSRRRMDTTSQSSGDQQQNDAAEPDGDTVPNSKLSFGLLHSKCKGSPQKGFRNTQQRKRVLFNMFKTKTDCSKRHHELEGTNKQSTENSTFSNILGKNQKHRRHSCCGIICVSSLKDGDLDVNSANYERNLRLDEDLMRPPRVVLKQNKVCDSAHMDRDPKNICERSDKDGMSQDVRHADTFSLRHNGPSPLFSMQESERDVTSDANKVQQMSPLPGNNAFTDDASNISTYTSDSSRPNGLTFQKQRCSITIPEAHPSLGNDGLNHSPEENISANISKQHAQAHSLQDILWRLLGRTKTRLEPEDFDKLFFWVMFALIIVTWMAFILPTHSRS